MAIATILAGIYNSLSLKYYNRRIINKGNCPACCLSHLQDDFHLCIFDLMLCQLKQEKRKMVTDRRDFATWLREQQGMRDSGSMEA